MEMRGQHHILANLTLGGGGVETGGLVDQEPVWKFRKRENLLLLPRLEPLSVKSVA
jgi:hypothetical protein